MDPYAFVAMSRRFETLEFDSLFCGTSWSAKGYKGVFNTLCRMKDEPDIYSGWWCVRGNRRPAQLRSSGAIRSLKSKLRDKCRSYGNTTDFPRVVGCLTVTLSVAPMPESSYTIWIPTLQMQYSPGSVRGRDHGLGRGRGLATSAALIRVGGTTNREEETDDKMAEEVTSSQP